MYIILLNTRKFTKRNKIKTMNANVRDLWQSHQVHKLHDRQVYRGQLPIVGADLLLRRPQFLGGQFSPTICCNTAHIGRSDTLHMMARFAPG